MRRIGTFVFPHQVFTARSQKQIIFFPFLFTRTMDNSKRVLIHDFQLAGQLAFRPFKVKAPFKECMVCTNYKICAVKIRTAASNKMDYCFKFMAGNARVAFYLGECTTSIHQDMFFIVHNLIEHNSDSDKAGININDSQSVKRMKK